MANQSTASVKKATVRQPTVKKAAAKKAPQWTFLNKEEWEARLTAPQNREKALELLDKLIASNITFDSDACLACRLEGLAELPFALEELAENVGLLVPYEALL